MPFGVLSRTPHPECPRDLLCRGAPLGCDGTVTLREENKTKQKKTWAPSLCCPCWCKKGAGHAVFCDAALPLCNPGALVQQEDLVLGQCLVSVGPRVVIVVIAVSLDGQTPGNEWPLLLCFGNVSCTSQLPVEDAGIMPPPDCTDRESPHLALQVRTLSPPFFFGRRLVRGLGASHSKTLRAAKWCGHW